MEALRAAHLFATGLWGGVALAEAVLEATARDPESRRAAARLHHVLDLWIEVPILITIVATGTALATRVTLVPLLIAKIALASVAIAANLWCVLLVVSRRRAIDDDARVARLTGQIRLMGLGIPFALAALAIGFVGF